MKALGGIRILDLTHVLSGPYATMMLADLGAETIKIEPPGIGEKTRAMLADDPVYSVAGMGVYFLALNRNKKSVTLDLKTDQGRAIFHELVRASDVVVYNFGAGVADRLQITRKFLDPINPRIITCSISGFGETGPNRELVSFDMVAQATGGGMSVTGAEDTPPVRAGIPIGDLGAGLMAAIGVLSALTARGHSGRGQHVDISMQDAQISLLNYMTTMYFMSGHPLAKLGNGHMIHVPYNAYPTADGWMIVAIVFDGFWTKLMEIVDCPQLDIAANRTRTGRVANREQIDRELAARFQTRSRAYWLEQLREARIPCAPVNSVGEAVTDPHVAARDMIVDVPHPDGGAVKASGNPIKLSGETDEPCVAPPRLGQHTDEILSELLGKSAEDIARLRADSII